jgi:hypothetical protein
MMELNREDVAELTDRFTTGTETFIQFQIAAVTPGSIHAGADLGLEDLPTASFRVYLVDDEQVNRCA